VSREPEDPEADQRDLFAIAAMVGLLFAGRSEGREDRVGEDAYEVADQMMAARARRRKK